MKNKSNALIKVLYVCPNGFVGGAEKAMIDFVKAHALTNRIEPFILFFNAGEATDLCQKLDISHYVLKNKFKLTSPFKLLRALLELRSFILKNSFTIIHSTMPYAHLVTSLALINIKNIKRVWFQHGPVGGLLDKLAALSHCDYLYFNSTYTKNEHLKSTIHMDSLIPHTIIPLIIHAPIDIGNDIENDNDKAQNLMAKKHSDIIISQLGRISPIKGYETTILAIKYLQEKFGIKNIVLNIYGAANSKKDEIYFEKLKETISFYQLENYVYFHPFTNHVTDIYHQSDLIIQSTLTAEAFGLVIAEAMINKCFVIAPNYGGHLDFFENNKTGFTFNAKKEDAHIELAETIQKFRKLHYADPEKINAMKEMAYVAINSSYNEKTAISQLEDTYFSLVP